MLVAFKFYARISRPGQQVQDQRNDANDQSSPKSGWKALDIEMRPQNVANKIEQQGIDDQREQAQSKNQQWQRNEHQNGAQDRVENAQEQRSHNQIKRLFIVDAFDNINRHQYRQSIDHPALKEASQIQRNLEALRAKRKPQAFENKPCKTKSSQVPLERLASRKLLVARFDFQKRCGVVEGKLSRWDTGWYQTKVPRA